MTGLLNSRISFGDSSDGLVHAMAHIPGTPKTTATVLCDLPLHRIRPHAEWEVGREKAIGIPANPFFSERQCGGCAERLAI